MADEKDVKQLLDAQYKLIKENNRMIKKMRGAQRRAHVFKFLYWLIIIGIAVGGFYFIKPYLESVRAIYNQVLPGLIDVADFGGQISDVGGNLFGN